MPQNVGEIEEISEKSSLNFQQLRLKFSTEILEEKSPNFTEKNNASKLIF